MPRAAPKAKVALRCFMLHGGPKNPSTIPRRANVFVAVGICRTWHRPPNLARFSCQVRWHCIGSIEKLSSLDGPLCYASELEYDCFDLRFVDDAAGGFPRSKRCGKGNGTDSRWRVFDGQRRWTAGRAAAA